MKNFSIFVLLVLTIFVGSCELVELEQAPTIGEESIVGPTTVPAGESEFLMMFANNGSKTWSATGFTLIGLEGFQDCRLDDKITINSDGTYAYDGGELLCFGGDNDRFKTGTWKKVTGETKIQFDSFLRLR